MQVIAVAFKNQEETHHSSPVLVKHRVKKGCYFEFDAWDVEILDIEAVFVEGKIVGHIGDLWTYLLCASKLLYRQ